MLEFAYLSGEILFSEFFNVVLLDPCSVEDPKWDTLFQPLQEQLF